MKRSTLHRASAAVVLALTGLLAACSAISGLDDLSFDGAAPGKGCTGDHDCAQANPCLVGTCGPDNQCAIGLQTEKPMDATPGDCKAPRCVDGALTMVDDDTDHPPSEACVEHACDHGAPTTHDLPNDAPCDINGNAGTCRNHECRVPCQSDADCTSTEPCQIAFCDTSGGICAFQHLDGVPVPGVVQTGGDCAEQACVAGVSTHVVDGSDLPKPPSASGCYSPACSPLGKPSSPPKTAGAACTADGGHVCDGAGNCIGCLHDTDCTGEPHTPCQTPVCKADGSCGIKNSPAGTNADASLQTPGDCRVVECDGQGQTKIVNDDDPPTDPSECRVDSCSGGNVVVADKPDGTSCGNNHSCLHGNCGCTTNADCTTFPHSFCDLNASSSTFQTCQCAADGCNSLGKTCGMANDGCGNPLNCNNGMKDGTETGVDCGGSGCTPCPVGQPCNANGDCSNSQCVDGFCCDTPASSCSGCNACSAALRGSGSNGTCGPVLAGHASRGQCTASGGCGLDGTCNGSGGCRDAVAGTACSSTCPNGSTQITAETCNGAGSCNVPGMTVTCANHFACAAGNCASSCPTEGAATNCAPGYVCHTGKCLEALGGACVTAANCASGFCIAGICCNSSCSGACQECPAPAGTCTTVKNQDLPKFCDATHGGCGGKCTCDAAGNCSRANGDTCAAATDCASGICSADGFCCSAACGACHTCSTGTCANAPFGQQPGLCDNSTGTCTSGMFCECNGGGQCKLQSGQACVLNTGCASGQCNGGICG